MLDLQWGDVVALLSYGGHLAGIVWVHLSPYRESLLQIQIPSRMKMSPSIGHEEALNVWWEWQRCESYVMAFEVTRSQPEVEILNRSVGQSSPPPSWQHQMGKYVLEEWCSVPPTESRVHQPHGALKLFMQHMVVQHFAKTLHVGFSFNSSLVCSYKDYCDHYHGHSWVVSWPLAHQLQQFINQSCSTSLSSYHQL